MFDTADYAEALEVRGDTDTRTACITVHEEDEHAAAEVEPSDLRALSVALLEVADRLDPPKPSLAIQADRLIRAGIQPCGTTDF